MTEEPIRSLVREGRLEQVEADRETALAKLAEAARHLVSASSIAELDPEGAYALLYDAARKALDAHMFSKGFRVAKGRLGGHQATAVYAVAVFGAGPASEHVRAFDEMRRNRNRSEYGAWAIGAGVLAADLGHALGIVEAVEAELGRPLGS